MGRYIFNGATALSLLVCLATVVFWIRGNWYVDGVIGGGQGYRYRIHLHSRKMYLELCRDLIFPDTNLIRLCYAVDNTDWREVYLLSMHWGNLQGRTMLEQRTSGPDTNLAISYWLILLLTLILPASRLRFRKRQLAGHCPNCHYDLRATRDRCPECGYVPARTADKRQFATENTEHTEEE